MPIPKDRKSQDLYSKVVGRNINEGKSREEAKRIADRAVKSQKKGKK
jgi:hypothetical protein